MLESTRREKLTNETFLNINMDKIFGIAITAIGAIIAYIIEEITKE